MHFALESKIRLKASHQRADTGTTFVCFKKRNIATGEKAIALTSKPKCQIHNKKIQNSGELKY